MFLVIAGAMAYQSIPKEAEPDVAIPIIYVSLGYQGISPEDSERMLLRPVETALQGWRAIKEMRSSAYQGGGFVLIEFQAGYDFSNALEDVRAKVNDAKRDLPEGADEPGVNEGEHFRVPRPGGDAFRGVCPSVCCRRPRGSCGDAIEEVPGVLEARLQGARDDLVGVVHGSRSSCTSYGLQLDQMIPGAQCRATASWPPAPWRDPKGRYPVRVPSLIEGPSRMSRNLPIVAVPRRRECARANLATIGPDLQRTPRPSPGLNGRPPIPIEVKKRVGANLVRHGGRGEAIGQPSFRAGCRKGTVVTLQPGQVGDGPHPAERSPEPRHDRRDPWSFIVILYALSGRSSINHRPGHSASLPDGHPCAVRGPPLPPPPPT